MSAPKIFSIDRACTPQSVRPQSLALQYPWGGSEWTSWNYFGASGYA